MTDEDPALHFSKLEALGNDFMLVDARSRTFRPRAGQIRDCSDRFVGVGFDQLLILRPAAAADHHCAVEIRNADGSEAEQCGNGMRAIALWLRSHDDRSGTVRLETAAGTVEVHCRSEDNITATLGVPDFSPAAVGLARASGFPWRVEIDGEALTVHGASLGNPHLLIVGDRPPAPERLERIGRDLGTHPDLTRGANVGLASIESAHRIRLRVFERGTGPTRACGSGAGAAAAILIQLEQVASPVEVIQPGGALMVNWSGPEHSIATTGPARHVFEGVMGWPMQPH